MRRTIFFDLDGTLADTDADIRLAWKAAIAEAGLSAPDFDEKFVAGPPFHEMVKTLFPGLEATAELQAQLLALFARHYDNDGFPNTREYPGIPEELRRLKSEGHQLLIVTNKRFAGARKMAAHFGWDAVFEGLYTGDMHPGEKLAKGVLLGRVMRERGLLPEACVMIGDTALDFAAARENAVASIGVTWGYGRPAELAQADRLCSHLPFPL